MAAKTTLDKDLKKIVRLEKATREAGLTSLKLGAGLLFLLAVAAYAMLQTGSIEGRMFVIAAGAIAGYMALNIGANDVANNMGPAVGSEALTMFGALIIATVFEAAGAILAGGDVVSTVAKSIIDPASMADPRSFVWAMMAALLAAGVWLNLATYVGAPVSTTHAIVGGVLGAGLAAAGGSVVNWPMLGMIAASWVISPLIGALIAALALAGIKVLIVFKDDKIAASRRWVPVFVAIMAGVFSVYLAVKGLKHVWRPGSAAIVMIGAAASGLTYAVVKAAVARAALSLENTRKSVSGLFTIPLICGAALLSFAHGANDVANAVGPLAAIVSAVAGDGVEAEVAVPPWVMLVGAFGISAGLLLFGPKLVRTVGKQITKLDRIRAFTVVLSAAITVIVASALGLPVSSTHITVGAVFGVGFLREYLANRPMFSPLGPMAVRTALNGMGAGDPPSTPLLPNSGNGPGLLTGELSKQEKKALKKARKRRLVRRRHLWTIIAAWLVTVPSAAALGAVFFFTLRGLLLP